MRTWPGRWAAACAMALLMTAPAWGQAGGSGRSSEASPRTTTITVTETAGVERRGELVEVSLRFQQDDIKGPREIGLFEIVGEERIAKPFQVIEFTPWTRVISETDRPTTFVRLAFQAQAPARGTTAYEVNLSPATSASPDSLGIAGAGLGKTITTAGFIWELDRESGQLLAISPRAIAADRLVFRQGELPLAPVHRGPDILVPPAPWGHAADWNLAIRFDPGRHDPLRPPVGDTSVRPFYYREWVGPLMYRLTRWGRAPYIAAAGAGVTYTFAAGAPVMRIQSQITIDEAMRLELLRDATLTFSRGQFDVAFWRDGQGRYREEPIFDSRAPTKYFGSIARLPADTPVIGFANRSKGYGVAYVTLHRAAQNAFTGTAATEQAAFEIVDSDEYDLQHEFNYVSLSRVLVGRRDRHPTYVPGGSTYLDEAAIIGFGMGRSSDPYAEVNAWETRLRHPLLIAAD